MSCRDIKKHYLIRAVLFIPRSNLNGIPRITQVYKVDSLDNATGMNVQAWNDPFRKHKKCFRLEITRVRLVEGLDRKNFVST
jgi:hypothetical protein